VFDHFKGSISRVPWKGNDHEAIRQGEKSKKKVDHPRDSHAGLIKGIIIVDDATNNKLNP